MRHAVLRGAGIAVTVLLAAAPAVAQDMLGELILYGPDDKPVGTMDMTSMFYALQPPGAPAPTDDKDQGHTITLTSQVHAPDPVFLNWLLAADPSRRVTLHVQDGAPNGGSLYELDHTRLTAMTVGYGGSNGSATLTIVPDHMTINGLRVF